MVDGIAAVAAWLRPHYQCMHRDFLANDYPQCYETPIHSHARDVRGETVLGWLWALARPGGDTVFEWRRSLRHEEAATLLASFKGVLHFDAYPAFASFAPEQAGVVCIGHKAHTRCRFHAMLEQAPVPAAFALRLIGQLYRLEAI